MKVREVMTKDPTCCTPDTSLVEVAQMMVRCDCGAIPVCDPATKQPVGMVTDRDIVVRAVAGGLAPADLRASDCMTSPVVTITDDTELEDCLERMQAAKVRRMIVVDRNGNLCGIVAQADISQRASRKDAGELVRKVSEPAGVLMRS